MANYSKKAKDDSNSISELIKLNTSANTILDDSSKLLNGSTEKRQDQLADVYSKIQNIVRSENSSMVSSKSSKDNVYDYLAKTVLNLDPTDPKSYNKMEKLLTGGDSNMSAFFMNTNSNYIALCDQIESICAYLYQLEDAIDVIRDNVLSSEEANEDISMDIVFPDIDGMASEYVEHIKQLADDLDIPVKLKDHVVPKAIKYGSYYVMTMPYNEIYNRMATIKKSEGNSQSSVKEFAMSDFKDVGGNNDDVKIIIENAAKIKIYDEDKESGIPILKDFKPLMETSITDAINKEVTKANKRKSAYDKYTSKHNKSSKQLNPEQSILDAQIDLSDSSVQLPGCFIKLIDPRIMRPVKIFDHIIGYYYFENIDTSKLGTSITEMMANRFNFNENDEVIDNIVNKILVNLKYRDLVESDTQFKSLILNSIMHKESRENLINIKFIPADYIVDFTTNKDEQGNGRPVLLRALYFGRLYVSLLNFNITTLVTKSSDTEFYYLRPPMDNNFTNSITDTIMQMKSSNIDASAIMNGDLMNGTRAIHKRYFTNISATGDKPFEVDIIPGQKIDLHDELMDKLLKMTIGSTGVPSVMIDNLDEVDYAIMVSQANIKNLKRCMSIQTDFNGPITRLYRNIAKFSNTQTIKPEILDAMKCTLRKPRFQHNNYSSDTITTVQSTVAVMVDVITRSQSVQLDEFDDFVKEELLAQSIMELTPSLPWHQIQSKLADAMLKARERQATKSSDEDEA